LSILGDAQQVASNFEVAIGAAGSLEAGMAVRQTVAQLSRAGSPNSLIRPQPPVAKLWGFYEHRKAILGRVQMHLAPDVM